MFRVPVHRIDFSNFSSSETKYCRNHPLHHLVDYTQTLTNPIFFLLRHIVTWLLNLHHPLLQITFTVPHFLSLCANFLSRICVCIFSNLRQLVGRNNTSTLRVIHMCLSYHIILPLRTYNISRYLLFLVLDALLLTLCVYSAIS